MDSDNRCSCRRHLRNAGNRGSEKIRRTHGACNGVTKGKEALNQGQTSEVVEAHNETWRAFEARISSFPTDDSTTMTMILK